jgi:hypothetical protein
MAERRLQVTTFSSVVVSTGISGRSVSSPRGVSLDHGRPGLGRTHVVGVGFRTPVKDALAPHVDEGHREDREEEGDLDEAGPAEITQRHGPRAEERHFDVEQQEDHRNQIELDRLTLPRIPDRRHPALVRRVFFGCRMPRARKIGQRHVDGSEADPERDHDGDTAPAFHNSLVR